MKILAKKFLYFSPIHYICVEFGVQMTEEDKKQLNTFEGKLRHFMFLYDELKKKTLHSGNCFPKRKRKYSVWKAASKKLKHNTPISKWLA